MVPHSREDRTVANSKDLKPSVSSKEDGERSLAESPQRAESAEPRSGCNIWIDLLLNLRLRSLFLTLLPRLTLDLFLDAFLGPFLYLFLGLFLGLSLVMESATGLPIR